MRIAFLLILLFLSTPVMAAESRIELTDGGVIVAQVVSMKDGLYTLESRSLGTIQVEASRIARIVHGAGTPGSTNRAEEHTLTETRERILGNARLLPQVLSLQNDPQFARALNDPEIMGAIRAGDLDTLQANPNFRRLLEHPLVNTVTDDLYGR